MKRATENRLSRVVVAPIKDHWVGARLSVMHVNCDNAMMFLRTG